MARRFGPVRDGSEGEGKEDLPWLEPAPESFEDEEERVVPRAVLIGGLVAFVAALAGLVGFIYFKVAKPGAPDTGPVDPDKLELIKAPAGPVRVRPSDPGGMQIDNKDLEVAQVTAGGQAPPPAVIGQSAEQPMPRPKLPDASQPPAPIPPVTSLPPAQPPKAAPAPVPATLAPKPAPAPAPRPVPAPAPQPVPAPAPPPVAAPATVAGGVYLQLGAFSERSRAEKAWSQAASSFASVGSLAHSIEQAGPAKFRLRAGPVSSVEEAQRICSELRAQNQGCIVAK